MGSESGRCVYPLAINLGVALALASCGGPRVERERSGVAPIVTVPAVPESVVAKSVLASLRARAGAPLPPSLADSFEVSKSRHDYLKCTAASVSLYSPLRDLNSGTA